MKRLMGLQLASALMFTVHAQVNIVKDNSFGSNGTVTIQTGLSAGDDHILLMPNSHSVFQGNKLFVAYPYSDPADPSVAGTQFTRLDANGSLDNSFGTNGNIRISDFEAYYYYSDDNSFYLDSDKRYLTNGQVDNNFANSGILQSTDWVYKTMLADGKILLRSDTGLNKFLADGNPDPSYGNNGSMSIDPGITGNANTSYYYFFNRGHFIYESVYPAVGQSNVRKVDLDTGGLDLTYGLNGYAYIRNSGIPSSANYLTSIASPENDGSFINKLSDGSNVYFTKTDSTGHLDLNFGNNGLITGNISFTYNGYTYSAAPMDPLVYSSMIIMPLEATDAQGHKIWGLNCYSLNGNSMTMNNSAFYPLSGISYESLGVLMSKDNYLYAISDNAITRYSLQRSVLSAAGVEEGQKFFFNNPFNDELTLHSRETIKNVEVIDPSGRIVLSGTSTKLNTSALPKGNYIINIFLQSGKMVSKKAIKK